MEVKQLDLTRQYQKLKIEIDKAIQDVCASGMFVLGEQVAKFEAEVAQYIGVNHAIGVNSGSAALNLALLALNIGPGDEIIVPANTYIATVFAVSHVGATPIFIDHDEYYNIDPDLIKKAITHKTKAIIPVHLYGQPCNMNRILDIAKLHNIFVVEDCAQAFGAEYYGKKVGTFSDIACVSFYPGKNIGACGDGGIVLTNNKELDARLRMLRNDGQVEKYKHEIIGFNERLDSIQAAILSVKLKYIDEWNQKRARIAKQYSLLIKERNLDVVIPLIIPNSKHVFHQYVILIKNRDEVKKRLLEEYKVATNIHYPTPCHKQKCYSKYNKINCPQTEINASKLLSLPIYPELPLENVKYVINCLEAILND
jgi:dTDP-4-amino-4,6-dideoxygalactose transaminase